MKNCPFCNSSKVGPCSNTHPNGHEITMIFCSKCGACGPVFTYDTIDDDEKSEAAWNSRSSYKLSKLFIFHDHFGNRISFSSFFSKVMQRLFSKKNEKITSYSQVFAYHKLETQY